MSDELKACPFCSCTDIGEVTINPSLKPAARRFKVYCKGCQIRTSDQATKKSARQQWNRRAMQGQGGEAVAWLNVATGCVTTLPVVVMDWDDEGEEVQSLYTHPADQVAERNAELVELLRGARAGLDNVGLQDSYIDYDAVSAISTRIDAKLASLKGVEE